LNEAQFNPKLESWLRKQIKKVPHL